MTFKLKQPQFPFKDPTIPEMDINYNFPFSPDYFICFNVPPKGSDDIYVKTEYFSEIVVPVMIVHEHITPDGEPGYEYYVFTEKEWREKISPFSTILRMIRCQKGNGIGLFWNCGGPPKELWRDGECYFNQDDFYVPFMAGLPID